MLTSIPAAGLPKPLLLPSRAFTFRGKVFAAVLMVACKALAYDLFAGTRLPIGCHLLQGCPYVDPVPLAQQSAAAKWEANTEDLLLRRSFRYATTSPDTEQTASRKRRYAALLEDSLKRILPAAHPPLAQ